MIIISKYLVPKGYSGVTIFPFIIFKEKDLKWNRVLLNHERIHLRQQLELFIIPFYIIYGVEFLIRIFQYRSWNLAYRNISFEKEAYHKENDMEYLNMRPMWNFLKYLRGHGF